MSKEPFENLVPHEHQLQEHLVSEMEVYFPPKFLLQASLSWKRYECHSKCWGLNMN